MAVTQWLELIFLVKSHKSACPLVVNGADIGAWESLRISAINLFVLQYVKFSHIISGLLHFESYTSEVYYS